MNKLETTHSARSHGPLSAAGAVGTVDFSRIRSNNAPFLAARASFLLIIVSFFGVRNTEIGFWGVPTAGVLRDREDGFVTDLMSWDFFSVVGVIVGGVFGREGSVYSDIEGVYKSASRCGWGGRVQRVQFETSRDD